MMKYVHTGMPTSQEKKWAGYAAEIGVHFTNPDTDNYGIEWLKFDADSPMPKMVQTNPHTAFQVDDLDAALVGKKILLPPTTLALFPGLTIAFIDHDGAIIELSQMR